MRDVLWGTRNALDEKAFSEQRLGGIGHLGPLDASIVRVVEVGIKKCCRSTGFNMMGYSPESPGKSATNDCCV